MVLVSIVSKVSSKLPRGINPEVVDALKEEIKYLVAVLTIFIEVFKAPLLAGFIVNVVSFYIISPENIFSWKITFTIFWAAHYALLLNQIVWTNGASFLIVMIVCRFFVITVRRMNTSESIETTVVVENQKSFFTKLNQTMYITSIPRRGCLSAAPLVISSHLFPLSPLLSLSFLSLSLSSLLPSNI